MFEKLKRPVPQYPWTVVSDLSGLTTVEEKVRKLQDDLNEERRLRAAMKIDVEELTDESLELLRQRLRKQEDYLEEVIEDLRERNKYLLRMLKKEQKLNENIPDGGDDDVEVFEICTVSPDLKSKDPKKKKNVQSKKFRYSLFSRRM